jgi:hypothetical protein
VEIEKTSKDINQRIKGLKLEKEKCQSDDFYRLADDIVKRVRRR